MELLLKLKHYFRESSLKSWVLVSIVIIVIAIFYREKQVEKMAKAQITDVLTLIQSSDDQMQATKAAVQDQEKEIESAFDQSFKKNHENLESGENAIKQAQNAIAALSNSRKATHKLPREPLISNEAPHTIQDVTVLRIAIDEALNKLMTLRTDESLEEYIHLQKQFASLVIEVFGKEKRNEAGGENE